MTPQLDSPRRIRARDRQRFVEPGLRPSESDQLPPWRIFLSLILLVFGFTGIFFGGSDVVGQIFLISGSTLMVAGLYLLGVFRFRSRRQTEDPDSRKLYGTRKA